MGVSWVRPCIETLRHPDGRSDVYGKKVRASNGKFRARYLNLLNIAASARAPPPLAFRSLDWNNRLTGCSRMHARRSTGARSTLRDLLW